MIGGTYAYAVIAAVVAGLSLTSYGLYQRGNAYKADLVAYKAQAEAEHQKLLAKSAEVKERVVTIYKDRIKTIRVPTPVEVVREIEIIRQSGCVLPPEFRVLHDSAATGESLEAAAGANGPAAPVDCATAVEVLRENYARARENSAQLEALQAWAGSVSE